jgi:hypothetical protein
MAEKPCIQQFVFFALVNWTQIDNVIDRPGPIRLHSEPALNEAEGVNSAEGTQPQKGT